MFFIHGPQRWNRGSTDGLFLLLLLLLPTSNFLFLLGTENTNFQTGLTFQASPVTPISSSSFSFYFLENFCLENCPLLSGELSTDFRQSSNSYFSSVQSSTGVDIKTGSQIKASPGLDIKLAHYYCLRKNRQYSQYSQSSRTILQTVNNRF